MIQSKEEIAEALKASFEMVNELIKGLSEDELKARFEEKWTPLQQFDHLIRSNKPIGLLLNLPKLALMIYGKSDNGSRSFDGVKEAYLNNLNEGGKASGDYIPKAEAKVGDLLLKWRKVGKDIENNLENWSEKDLDRYRAPHPLLGKMTVRELLFFTVYHNQHHVNSIKTILAAYK